MTEFVQSKKGKITIAIIILVLLGLIIGMLLVKGPNDKDKDGNKVNIETGEPEREVIEKDENTVEETHKDGLTVVEDENADVDGSDFAEFPEVDEEGNVIPSDDKADDKTDDKTDDGKDDDKTDDGKDDDKTDDGKDDDKTDDDKDDDEKDPTGTWGPFF